MAKNRLGSNKLTMTLITGLRMQNRTAAVSDGDDSFIGHTFVSRYVGLYIELT